MVRKILSAKEPTLRLPSKAVPQIDKKVVQIVNDLKETLATQKDPEGVGLAAPQIGKNLKIFVVSFDKTDLSIINPEVVSVSSQLTDDSGKKDQIMEGCLSLPHFYGPLKRAKSLTIKYLTEKGEEKTQKFEGFLAQIIQHEMDHLKGILFVDRLIEQKRSLFKLVNEEWEEVEWT
jgi:peptide deformylase